MPKIAKRKRWCAPKGKAARRALLEKCGREAFLLPDGLKYPVMDSACRISCKGLLAAQVRAAQHAPHLVPKIKRLRRKLCGV